MSADDLVILQKMYDFYLWVYPALGRYPKHEKFVLTTQTKNTCLRILTLIVKANKVKARKPVLFEIDTELEMLRLLFRLAHDVGYLSVRKYELRQQLLSGTYRTGPYRFFRVYEPKERLVAALPFKDRVVQHAIVRVIEPLFERQFIGDSYACRKGKGTHAGADRLQGWLRSCRAQWGRVYCLKADVKQYFPSINHAILRQLIRRTIKDPKLLEVIDGIIASTAEDGDPNPKGLPIGNLTSQLFANVYLNQLDQFVKHRLKARFYIRYMDDFVLLAPDKAILWGWRSQIEQFLKERLALELHPKSSIFPVGPRCVDFLGYRIWPSFRLLRKASVKRMKRKMRRWQRLWAEGQPLDLARVRASLMSWLGHAGHANTYRLRKRLLGEFVLSRKGYSGAATTSHAFGVGLAS